MSEVKFKLAAGTNVGLIRQNNEDNFVVCSDLSTSNWLVPNHTKADAFTDLGEYGILLVVADGMGGANAGEVASSIAVETIQSQFKPEMMEEVVTSDKSIQTFMKDVVKSADLNILHHSQEDSSTQGMGTTVVMAWVLNDKAYICWCGDSRCYVLNKRNGLIQLSKDHSYVQELVDKGELSAELMHDHPLSNIITRCLGDVQNRADPETRVYQIQNDDIIMLCSDGLCGICHDTQILDVMIKFCEDPAECKNELISAALNNGGYDNVTVALCKLQMEGAGEEGDAAAEEETQEADADATATEEEEEDLSTTIRTEVIGRKKRRFPWFLVIFLILLAGAAYAAYHFYPTEFGQTIDQITDWCNKMINKLKTFIQ